MENLELLAERAEGNRFVEFIKSPKVWATAVIIIVLVALAGTYKYWKPVLSSSNKSDKVASIDLNAALAETYKNSSLGLTFTYPTGWTVPVESVKNGVMLLESPDKKLSLEFIKGICFKTTNVLCMNGYQITMNVPKADESSDSDLALLQSIVDSVEFGK